MTTIINLNTRDKSLTNISGEIPRQYRRKILYVGKLLGKIFDDEKAESLSSTFGILEEEKREREREKKERMSGEEQVEGVRQKRKRERISE